MSNKQKKSHPIITRGPKSRLRTETHGDVIVDYLPMPIRYCPKYRNRAIENPLYVPLDLLSAEPVFTDFETISKAIYHGKKELVIARMYHWTDGEDLQLEDLTRGRLYFSYDPRHWIEPYSKGRALFRVTCCFRKPITLLDQAQPYSWCWERIENRLDKLQLPRDSLFHSCLKPHQEPPLGFVYNAQASIVHTEYVGTVA